MGFTVRLYHGFHKDLNSTKQPAIGNYSSYDDYTCELFEPCSVINPRIRLALPVTYVIANVNYAYISQFSRYYWVNDAEWTEGTWVLTLNVDVLATYKSNIGSSSQYVIRSQSASDGGITDMAYPFNGQIQQSQKLNDSWVTPFKASLADGIFIVGIVGQSDDSGSARFGAVNYYEFSVTEFNDFMTALMSNSGDWIGVATDNDLKSNTVKMILNPMQYITTCQWIPLTATGTSSSRNIKFGWWTINSITCRTPGTSGGIPGRAGTIGFNISSIRHPQASARGAYLNRAPYSEYKLYIPQLGNIDIPADIVANVNYIKAAYTIDYPTGTGVFDINGFANADGTGTGTHIAHTSCKIGVEVPIAQIAVDTIGTAQSGLGLIGSAANGFASGGILGGILGLVGGAIDTAVRATQPIPNIMASTGSIAPYQTTPAFNAWFKKVADDSPTLIGKPLCDERTISTLSGYILCGTAHLDIPGATETEVARAESFLKEGFRYE